jgi:glycerate 2-kinase
MAACAAGCLSGKAVRAAMAACAARLPMRDVADCLDVRVLVCPDKFAGTLTAIQAATAVADGWLDGAPDDEVATIALADGGPGFLDVVRAASGGRVLTVPACDPLGRPVRGDVVVAGDTAYLESAQVCGLHLVAPAERDPKHATSYGLGMLIATAVDTGVRRVVVGLGGSATNDAGAGMLACLGAAPLDAAGYALGYGGAALLACASLGGVPRLRDVGLIAAADVDAPLTGPSGATAVFGPQKGASADDVALLDAALARFAWVLERDLPTCPAGVASMPGAGAAGGLGAALLACGAHVVSGFGLIREVTSLDAALDACDVVVTGEGSFDSQSLRGKVVAGVARLAAARGLPCVVIAGRVDVDLGAAREVGVSEAFSLVECAGGEPVALAEPVAALRRLAAHVARHTHSRPAP